MKVTFLGTGGGRFVTSQQLLATGGFVVELDGEKIHIDPGPGALVRAKQYGMKLGSLTGVVVTHSHTDHCTDAPAVIEAMTSGTVKKRGVVVGNKTVFEGSADGEFRPILSEFHKRCVEAVHQLAPGEKAKIGKVTVTATPTRHTEPFAIGMVLDGSKRIGYTSDTEYIPEMDRAFAGCDVLVVNCPQPWQRHYPMYMNSADVASFIQVIGPETTIIQHFGMLIWKAGIQKQSAWIAKKSGRNVIAATDGMIWKG